MKRFLFAALILVSLATVAGAQGIRIVNAPPTRLVFAKGDNLWVLEKNARAPHRIESGDWISPSSPSFIDPNGDSILFAAHRRERYGRRRGQINIDRADLYLAGPTGIAQLTDDRHLSTSPHAAFNGEEIVFISNKHALLRALMPRTGTRELYILSAPWNISQRLTRDGGNKYNPSWSPDGATLAYLWLAGDSTGLYLLDMAHQDTTPISLGVSGDYPTWSPDQTALAYVARGRLFALDLPVDTTTKPRPLTPDGFHGFISFPRWTAHGILFHWARGAEQGLALLNPQTRRIRELVSGSGEFGGADLADR